MKKTFFRLIFTIFRGRPHYPAKSGAPGEFLKKPLLASTRDINSFPSVDTAPGHEGRREEGKRANRWERLPVARLLDLVVDLTFCRESWEWLPTGLSGALQARKVVGNS